MEQTVKIPVDVYLDLLQDRVDEFKPAEGYPQSFWDGVWEFFKSVGFPTSSDGCVLSPSVIVDNIAVNGEIKTSEELKSEYGGFDEKSTEAEIQEYADENGWDKIGDYWVINWGV